MSKTIDERVVEMRFDNKHFESNVQTTMSTLDKLKQKLNFTGATKGLSDVGAAAKKVDMHGLGSAVETVSAKFSAMQVVGMTALANITNSAINTGKRMMSALTIDPIKTGLSEYETKINAIQVIQANTRGVNTMEDITKALDELNTYADNTIYNFAQMTSNIGKFTAQGFDVQSAANAVKGMANLAAASGASAEDMARATYQMSQAMGNSIKLMDWNSLRTANMATQDLKETLISLARVHGIAIDDMIAKEGTFEYTLQNGWLSGEMFTEAMNIYSGVYSDAELAAKGFTEAEIANFKDLAATAESAATEVKTFTQLWDVLKETAQSGWTQTWELIIGDFESAKKMWTGLQVFFSGIINGWSNARNALLKGALGKSFEHISKVIKSVTEPVKKSAESVKNVVDSVKDYGDIVNKIISGELGTGQKRWDKLAKAGYDWAHAQNLVNEKLGDTTRHATKYKEAQKGVTDAQKDSVDSQNKMSDSQVKYIASLTKMSEGLLRSKGYTTQQIQAFKELGEMAEKTGIPIEDFIKNIDKIDGRFLLLNGFKNIGLSIVTVFKSIGEAWRNAFPPMQSDQLFNIIAGFHKLTTKLVISEETAKNLTRTFKGVFAIIDILTTVLGGGFKIAFKLLSSVLSHFNLDILDVTASIGDSIVAFRDWFDGLFDVGKVLDVIVPTLKKAGKAIKDWIKSFKEIPQVQEFVSKITGAFDELKNLDFKEIGRNIIDGLKNGLGDGAGEVIDRIVQIAKDLIAKFCAILGIHSPSKEFEEIGGNIIDGLLNGLQNGIKAILDFFSGLASNIMNFISQFNWGKAFAVLISGGLLYTINNISKAIGSLASPFEGLGDLFGSTAKVLDKSAKGIKKVLKSTSKVMNSFAFSVKAKALKNIAISLLMLVGAVAVLTFLDVGKLWNAVGVITVLSLVLAGLAFAVSKMSDASASIGKDGLKINGLTQSLAGIGVGILLLAATVKLLGTMDWKQGLQGMAGLVLLIGGVALVFLAFGKLVKGPEAAHISKAGSMLMKVSIALLLLIGVIKLAGNLSETEVDRGMAAMVVFGSFLGLLGAIGRLGGEHVSKFGTMCIKIGIALAIMVGVVKLIGGLSDKEMERGGIAMLAFVGFVGTMAIISRLSGGVKGLGSTLLAISVSMILLIGVCKLLNLLTVGEIIKGGLAIVAFAGIIYLLIKIVKTAGSSAPKIAGTLLALSASIAILAGVAVLLSLVDLPGLIKGVTAVTILGGVMTAMIWATRGANDVKGNLIAMTVAIGIMAASVAALSFIEPSKLAGATAALAILMGMFALMEKMSSNVTGSMTTTIVMTVVIGLLAGVLWLLQGLPVESTLAVAASLSMLMLSLSVSLKIISTASPLAVQSLIPLGLMVVIMGLVGGILWLLKDLPVESIISNAIALSLLMITLTAVTAAIGLIAPLIPGAMTAALGLGVVIAELALVLAALGGLAQIPGLQWLISEGGNFLQTIGTAIGQFVGGIIGGIAQGVTSSLPQIGIDLSTFMTNLQPFLDGANSIDPSIMEGVKTLSEAMLIITGAQLLSQITSWISGGASLSDFGAQLAKFGESMKAYSDAVAGINTEAITASATAAKGLAEVARAIPASGDSVWATLAGEQNLGTFGLQLAKFGESMKTYAASVTGIDTGAITNSATAAKGLTEVANAIPKNGTSIWSLIAGGQDLGLFGVQLAAFGRGMKKYSESVTGIDTGAITTSVSAAKGLVSVANAIPKNGTSIWSLIAGKQDLGKFGTQMTKFGKGLKKYASTVTGMDTEAINSSVSAAKGLVRVANTIPKGDSFWDKLTGKQDLGDFGNKLVPFGKSLKKYSEAVAGVSSDSISGSVSGARSLSKFISGLGDINTDGVDKFKKAVNSLAKTNIDGFVKAFSGSAAKVSTAGGNLVANLIKGVNAKKGNMTSTANSIIALFVNSANSKAKAVTTVGVNLMAKFVAGISKSKSKVKSAVTGAVSSSVSGLRGYYGKFYNAGSYLVSGFAKGISDNSYKAAAKSKAMAKAAEEAARKELAINSPSKKFIKIGSGIPEGFAIGITHFGSSIKKSVRTMADTAIENTQNAMSWVAKAVDSDLEYKPTISPVMDLSSVNTGIGAINSMFSDKTLGVTANLNAVSSMMNGRLQNGNDDVVAAINKLRKSLGNIGNTNYNINGITYDDGSNINDAVQAIVRAARMEGRV